MRLRSVTKTLWKLRALKLYQSKHPICLAANEYYISLQFQSSFEAFQPLVPFGFPTLASSIRDVVLKCSLVCSNLLELVWRFGS